MLDLTPQHIRDRLHSAMPGPREPFDVIATMIGAEIIEEQKRIVFLGLAQPDRTMQMDASAFGRCDASTTLRTRDIASCLPSLHRSRPLIDWSDSLAHFARESVRPKGGLPLAKSEATGWRDYPLRSLCRHESQDAVPESPTGRSAEMAAAVASFHLAGSPTAKAAEHLQGGGPCSEHRPRCVAANTVARPQLAGCDCATASTMSTNIAGSSARGQSRRRLRAHAVDCAPPRSSVSATNACAARGARAWRSASAAVGRVEGLVNKATEDVSAGALHRFAVELEMTAHSPVGSASDSSARTTRDEPADRASAEGSQELRRE